MRPNEKLSFKIYKEAGERGEFPKTDSIVKAEGEDFTNMKTVSLQEQIEGINNITKALKGIPTEVVTTVTTNENGTKEIANNTVTIKMELNNL